MFCSASLPLEVLGVELGRDSQDTVVDGGDVGQLLLLRLPGDEGLPQAIGAEVCAGCKHRMFVGTDGGKMKGKSVNFMKPRVFFCLDHL